MKLYVEAPATTANLSCGFDVLGLALDLTYRVEVETLKEQSFLITCEGEGKGLLPEDEENLFFRTVQKTWEYLGYQGPGLKVRAWSSIPIARGLGSSAACIVAGIVTANALSGENLTLEDMLRIAVALEGHPDNVVPAFLGGFTIALARGNDILYQKLSFALPIHFYVLIPNYPLSTETMRQVLPRFYVREDVVFSLSHLAFLLGSLLKGDVNGFLCALEDRIHEPYREKYVVGFPEVKAYVKKKGIGNAAISGSGPTILLCLCRPLEEGERREIEEIFSSLDVCVGIRKVFPREEGVRVMTL
ncbi:MAG: homoserine kinase [Candidatus Caldatribacterium sp.]|uniref:homoserine kinase n=1 Tax=Candidatus Caldatribacterium sp. TaxID=2282143 RepID=UPI0029986B85|nr:homoserine kinase [Candidatus Caldatribacterium sp.]MCX7731107.1 homoserine kinase [Candidatus Caldatribacterium sp.]MDW8081390.1 homoserine kinase [Candidatus Calescibacterium sp.]